MSGKSPVVAAFVAAAPSVDSDRRTAALAVAHRTSEALGGVLMATCHRVELYVEDLARIPQERLAALNGAAMTVHTEDEAARHVIELGLGLRSSVVGEDQVLHQLRRAVGDARLRGASGPHLDLLLDLALHAARIGRSWRPTTQGFVQSSLADRAVDRAAALLGGAKGRSVLVVGAGEMGRATASAALRRGAHVRLTSPTHEHAEVVAGDLGIAVATMDPDQDGLDVEAIFVALAGPWVMREATARFVEVRPAVVVDLSMPSALSPDSRRTLAGRLIDIDDLAQQVDADVPTTHYRTRLQRLADRTLIEYGDAVADRRRSSAERLAERVERQRIAELDDYLRRRPDLGDDARLHLDEVTRELSARLFREPLARLARDPDGRRRRAFDELFGG